MAAGDPAAHVDGAHLGAPVIHLHFLLEAWPPGSPQLQGAVGCGAACRHQDPAGPEIPGPPGDKGGRVVVSWAMHLATSGPPHLVWPPATTADPLPVSGQVEGGGEGEGKYHHLSWPSLSGAVAAPCPHLASSCAPEGS